MRKQLDPRLPILINNNVKLNHRSFIVLVGDKGRDQIVNLHFLLSQARVSARPSVLWCYKKELGFTTHRKKREAKIKREVKKGIREPNEQNPFEIFVTVTDIRYTYYKESHKILGNTYGMLVLQDFEAITPNLLARTIETVEGGGLVVLLLKTMSSLKQLYSMTMDVHSRYRTSSHHEVTARFNERFILSLGSNPDCLFLDDELNVLPISRGKDIVAIEDSGSSSAPTPDTLALKQIQTSLSSTPPAGPLIALAKTSDQAKALLTFIEAIQEKTLSSTVTLTAGRGRGKSASLGLAIAAALACGYSNVFVTSPSPENLKAVFEFVFKGLDALGYEEHLDYDIAQSTNPEFGNAIVRVNVFRDHRQTVQYIAPEDAHVLGQAELVVIDEAAAIPLPLVKQLIGPYLVFMASTINGYEGTGRSLSLKLIQQLRESTRPSLSKEPAASKDAGEGATTSTGDKKKTVVKAAPKTRTLREVKLDVPIRYSTGDKIESWLNGLLCLDATVSPSSALSGCPHPSQCELYEVSRDTLFSYHPASEVFLQRMMALYVASHYKNQPNDLQLMSDAPAHALFVLLPPLSGAAAESGKDGAKTLGEAVEGATHLPEPLVVLQVALEGSISRDTILDALGRGLRPGGDMIPWLISQQFQEPRFGKLSGARVVRVAVHPDYANMGYGSRALQALNAFYSGEYYNFDADFEMGDGGSTKVSRRKGVDDEDESNLLTETPTVRAASSMPPLLQRLSERKPENLDYLGVSYGLTPSLLRFWKRAGYVPLYVRQTASELTGEHTCVMVRGLNASAEGELEWLGEFAKDFRRRFISLLSYKFREFGSVTALSILEAVNMGVPKKGGGVSDVAMSGPLTSSEMAHLFTAFDLKRLEAYANNTLDYHVIQDLFPAIASLYFAGRFENTAPATDGADGEVEKPSGVRLTAVQSSILLALGLQRKSIEDVERELSLPVNQALALLVKIVRKISKRLVDIQKAVVSASIPDLRAKTDLLPAASTSRVESADEETEAGGPSRKAVEEWQPSVSATIEKELEEAGGQVDSELRERQKAMLDSLDLRKFAINDAAVDWDTAAAQVKTLEKGGHGASTIVSVKSTSSDGVGQKRKAPTAGAQEDSGVGAGKKNRRSKKVKR
ncbi:N-acetyltransferase 10 [Coprinopsis sp. MPI-PUGE-AT-0042]|nr:N-acetyltransferase 10 [Coprinopsis sp. MPI-PUGE-AT-0042]